MIDIVINTNVNGNAGEFVFPSRRTTEISIGPDKVFIFDTMPDNKQRLSVQFEWKNITKIVIIPMKSSSLLKEILEGMTASREKTEL